MSRRSFSKLTYKHCCHFLLLYTKPFMVIFTFVRHVSRLRCAMRLAVSTYCNFLWLVFPSFLQLMTARVMLACNFGRKRICCDADAC